jgi:NADPH:quinone reductase-like Zn-dependent oxidoreductase
MKAIVQRSYGGPDTLQLGDVERPALGPNEILVRVHAASIHLGDAILMRGEPFVVRFATGLRKPKNPVPGTDLAGTVEAVGQDVTLHRPGDEVMGWAAGAFAEYASAPEDQFVAKPVNLAFHEAAAIGISATAALQLLRDDGKVQPGQKVLVNGASGGVGTFAVQIAKAFGAEVTGVASSKNLEVLRSIGADHVVDYTRDDFTAMAARYDLIFDNVGQHSMARTRRALTPGGILISNGGGHAGGKLARTLRTMLVAMFVRQQAAPSVKRPNRADLIVLRDLVEAGKLRPVVDSTYPLARTGEAIARVMTSRARGTIVVSVIDAPIAAGAESRPTHTEAPAAVTLAATTGA